ncbi:MAG: S-methyl-5-thioribose-1-phosphate isomerase, partial [Actinomycetota bacterium]
VFILDRRVYPFEVRYEHCRSYEETAQAIEAMVTQSGGPGLAAAHGMIQAARVARNDADPMQRLRNAGERLRSTRPTHNQIRRAVDHLLIEAERAVEGSVDLEDALIESVDRLARARYDRYRRTGEFGASLLDDGDTLLTHCWGEGGIVFTVLNAVQQGKAIEAFVTETRPYLQGARLTADALLDMGVPTTVMTDGMHAGVLAERVSVFMTGADLITMSGHVVNKVGTFPIALMAHHFGVPYYAFGIGPDPEAETPDDVVIEDRDPEEALHCRGLRTATPRAGGHYPAFDITPPEYVTGIATSRGVFAPTDMAEFVDADGVI